VTGSNPPSSGAAPGSGAKVIHVTTVDMSLDLLLKPQLVAFAEAGYEVVGASAPGPHVEELEAVGVRHVPLVHATRSMDPVADLRLAWELYRLFVRERPDVVHTHTPKPGWFGRPAARAARVPAVVNTVHGLYATPDDGLARRAVVYALERAASACSDAELLQSSEDVPVLRRLRVPQRKLTVLGNGIDLARFAPPTSAQRSASRAALGLADHHVAVGVVCRLVWEKGLREVIAMATELRRTHPSARVLVAGGVEPDKADGLTALDLERVSAESGIEFVGELRPIDSFYDALDLYVLASYREGFPRSAMEAAAKGLPLVLTDIRGCRQVVDPEVNGALVPPRDAGALTAAVSRLVDDADLRTRLGEGSTAKAATDFDQQNVIDITLDTYARLLGNRAS